MDVQDWIHILYTLYLVCAMLHLCTSMEGTMDLHVISSIKRHSVRSLSIERFADQATSRLLPGIPGEF